MYGHANGTSIEDAVEAVGRYVEAGYKAVRVQSALPGLDQPYGVGRGDLYYEPAEIDLPLLETFDSGPYLRGVPRLFAAAARPSAGTSTCSTTSTTASLLARQRNSVWPSSPTSCSGWRTLCRANYRSRCASCANTR